MVDDPNATPMKICSGQLAAAALAVSQEAELKHSHLNLKYGKEDYKWIPSTKKKG